MVLKGPYKRRRMPLRLRLKRIGLRGWLWILAAGMGVGLVVWWLA